MFVAFSFVLGVALTHCTGSSSSERRPGVTVSDGSGGVPPVASFGGSPLGNLLGGASSSDAHYGCYSRTALAEGANLSTLEAVSLETLDATMSGQGGSNGLGGLGGLGGESGDCPTFDEAFGQPGCVIGWEDAPMITRPRHCCYSYSVWGCR
jgi:hypothetical protein